MRAGVTVSRVWVNDVVQVAAGFGVPPSPTLLCQGCGGAEYNLRDFNRPARPDELIQRIEWFFIFR